MQPRPPSVIFADIAITNRVAIPRSCRYEIKSWHESNFLGGIVILADGRRAFIFIANGKREIVNAQFLPMLIVR